MEVVKEIYKGIKLTNNELIVGDNIKGGEIQFYGVNNKCIIEDNVDLSTSNIKFYGDNAIAYISTSIKPYIIEASIHDNCCLFIGKNNYFNGTLRMILSEGHDIIIGDGGVFSFGIWMRNADAHLIYDANECYRINHSKNIYIGDHVWIGQNAMILKGTRVGSGSIIGAMSVITGKVPSNTCYAGNPGKMIKRDVFWRGDCVHRWNKKMTELNDIDMSGEFIYRGKSEIDEIDYLLNKYENGNDKINVIPDNIMKNSESRFFIPHSSVFKGDRKEYGKR